MDDKQIKNEFIFFDYNFENFDYNFTRYKINYVVGMIRFFKNCKLNLKFFLRKNDICIKISDTKYLILFFNVPPKSILSPVLCLEKKIIEANNYMLCSKDLFHCVFCNRCEQASLKDAISCCIKIINDDRYFSKCNIFTGV